MKATSVSLLFSTLAVVALVIYFWHVSDELHPGRQIPQGLPGGNFVLASAAGPVSLSDFNGQVVVLFFGYSHCPDICPLTLATLTQALQELDQTERSAVQGLFVSLDPARDQPEYLAEYTAHFSPQILGLTGSASALEQVTRQYGAYFRRSELRDSALGYAIDHSTRLYLIDRQGQLQQTLSHSQSPQQLASAIRDLL